MRLILPILRAALACIVLLAFALAAVPSLAAHVPWAADLGLMSQGGLSLAVVAAFPTSPELIATAMAYRNKRLIADSVLPRLPVGKQEFKYYTWNLGEGFTIPNTAVGRTSKPNEVEFSATETPSATLDYALDDPIPQADLDNAPTGINPRSRATEGLTDLILLDREVRTAGVVFNANTYGAANKVTLAGTSQFSDTTSDPIATIQAGLDALLVRPNVMVIGRPAWSVLARHPKIVAAVNRNAGQSGIAAAQAVADLFELEEILVGEAFLNTAKRGQAANLSRVWGKHIALIYRDTLAAPNASQSRMTFGFTAQWGDRVAGSNPDPNIGMRGGERVRVGESVKEEICAAALGYFIQNAVA